MTPYVLMRSHNDMPLIRDTLKMLHQQEHPFRLLVLDNASTDGTLEEVNRYGAEVIHVPPGGYVPGRVLNTGMRATEGEIVVFLNSDCTPADERFLGSLLQGFDAPDVAAVFGQQIPRPDCFELYARDTAETYGDGRRQSRWRHCFSMAASAIRRSVWDRLPFDESLQYSEDQAWTWHARQLGNRIRYIPDAMVVHSHNYTPRQFIVRQFGEARAEARIFDWNKWQRSFLRYALLPGVRMVVDDVRHCLRLRRPGPALCSPPLRLLQVIGRYAGLMRGLREEAICLDDLRATSVN
jgi:rhamnosyltransferase